MKTGSALLTVRLILTGMLLSVAFHVQTGLAQANDAQIKKYMGELEVIYVDFFNHDKDHLLYQLNTQDGQTLFLNLPESTDSSALETGMQITVQGRQSSAESFLLSESAGSEALPVIDVEALDIPPQPQRLTLDASEDRHAVVLMVDFNDKKASDVTSISHIENMMYTGTKSTDQIYQESSFGNTRFIADTDSDGVSDIFHIQLNYDAGGSCDYNKWANDAEAAAANMGVDLSLYQHKVTVLSNQVSCGWGGLGHLGCNNSCRAWVKWHSTIVYAHELGHNLRMHHATTDPENDGTINSEYGDHSGIMGNNTSVRQVNGPHRIQMDWYADFPDQVTEVTTSETLELYPLENDPSAGTQGLQVISIPRSSDSEKYYLSYRKNIGTFGMGNPYRDRVNVHRFRGGSSKTIFIKALAAGETFVDEVNNIEVQALDAGGDTASVQISLDNSNPDVVIKQVSFLGAHDMYLVAVNDGGKKVKASSTSVTDWELFDIKLVSSGQDQTCIQGGDLVSVDTGKGFFLTTNNKGKLRASATEVGDTETFTVINTSGSTACLQSGDAIGLKSVFNRYMLAKPNGQANMKRKKIGEWTQFILTF